MDDLRALLAEWREMRQYYQSEASHATAVAIRRGLAGEEHAGDSAAAREFRAWANCYDSCIKRLEDVVGHA